MIQDFHSAQIQFPSPLLLNCCFIWRWRAKIVNPYDDDDDGGPAARPSLLLEFLHDTRISVCRDHRAVQFYSSEQFECNSSPQIVILADCIVLINVFPIHFLSDFRVPNLSIEDVPYRKYSKRNDGWWYKLPVYFTGCEQWIKCTPDFGSDLTFDNMFATLQKHLASSTKEK